MGWEQKSWKEGGGGGERRERLPANPSILKNAHWFSWLSSLTDWQLCHRTEITMVRQVSTNSFGRSNVCLRTSLSYGLTMTVHLLDGHFMPLKKNLPVFSLIRDFGKKTPVETFPKFPSVLRVIDRSDRNPPITATSVTFWPSLRHAGGLWLADFDPICR